jgi:hypothetical protein
MPPHVASKASNAAFSDVFNPMAAAEQHPFQFAATTQSASAVHVVSNLVGVEPVVAPLQSKDTSAGSSGHRSAPCTHDEDDAPDVPEQHRA